VLAFNAKGKMKKVKIWKSTNQFVVEEDIVVALAVERRVNVDQINAFVRHAVAQHVKAIAEVECVHCYSRIRT
jgi:hypothetical protein